MRPATQILLFSLAVAGAWLTGIYFGATWERESMVLVSADRLCVCKP
jgi:hypothetical protein